MRLVALQSFMSDEAANVSGCSRPPWPSCFQSACVVRTSPPAPVLLRVRVHPLVSFSSSSEYKPLRTCPARTCEDAFLGVSFPIATPATRVHSRASIPSSPYGPPSAFLTPSTACSSPCLAGLFHPAATSGIHVSGALSRCQAEPPRRRPVPSCRSRRSPTAELPRRLQIPPSAFRVLIQAAIRGHRQVV